MGTEFLIYDNYENPAKAKQNKQRFDNFAWVLIVNISEILDIGTILTSDSNFSVFKKIETIC